MTRVYSFLSTMRNQPRDAPTQPGARCPRCDGVLRFEGDHCSACESTIAVASSPTEGTPIVRHADDRPRLVTGARRGERYVIVGAIGSGGVGERWRALE